MFASALLNKFLYIIAAVTILLAGCSTQQEIQTVEAAGPSGVQNVLLVHGAWADGSCWSQVITNLTADGYNVTAVQLPLTSLTDDVAVLQRAIARETGKTLVVAHSYGGIVITQAATDPKVAGLVYVSAYAPAAGESALTLNNTVASTPIDGDLQEDASGFLTLSSAGVAADFAQDLPAGEQVTIAATQGPISAANAFSAPVTEVAWKNLPSWYIIASNDRAISPALEATMAKRMSAKTLTLQSGHLSMLSHPTDVSTFIESAATSLKP